MSHLESWFRAPGGSSNQSTYLPKGNRICRHTSYTVATQLALHTSPLPKCFTVALGKRENLHNPLGLTLMFHLGANFRGAGGEASSSRFAIVSLVAANRSAPNSHPSFVHFVTFCSRFPLIAPPIKNQKSQIENHFAGPDPHPHLYMVYEHGLPSRGSSRLIALHRG
jgi:hypothetical protein